MTKLILIFNIIILMSSCSTTLRLPKAEYQTKLNRKNINYQSGNYIYIGSRISIIQTVSREQNSTGIDGRQSRVYHEVTTQYLEKGGITYDFDFAGLKEVIADRPDLILKLKKIKRKELYRKPGAGIIYGCAGVGLSLFGIFGATSLITKNKTNIPYVIGFGAVGGLSASVFNKIAKIRNYEILELIKEYNKV